MSDTIRVTVAPGSTYTLSPHPSGLACLPALELGEGQTFDTSPAEAQRLYDQRRIVHWTTGEVKPWPAQLPAQSGVRISYGGGAMHAADGQEWVADATRAEHAAQADYLARQNAELAERNAAIRPHNAIGPVRPSGPLSAASDLLQPVDPFGSEHVPSHQEQPR